MSDETKNMHGAINLALDSVHADLGVLRSFYTDILRLIRGGTGVMQDAVDDLAIWVHRSRLVEYKQSFKMLLEHLKHERAQSESGITLLHCRRIVLVTAGVYSGTQATNTLLAMDQCLRSLREELSALRAQSCALERIIDAVEGVWNLIEMCSRSSPGE